MSSGWFGDFSWGESTYSDEGVDASKDYPGWSVAQGRDPSVSSSYHDEEILSKDFFHESESGGPDGAWQTHFPAAESLRVPATGLIDGVGRHLSPFDAGGENNWVYTPSGWIQDYSPPVEQGEVGGKHLAAWFDSSIRQIDRLGRQSMPTAGTARSYSNRSYLNGWSERSVNTSITCKTPGCSGSSSLQLFDPATEEGQLCGISIFVHATDYDDDWSKEHIEYWKVNGAIASRQCNPRARGCNSTAARPLYPCVNTLNVDSLVNTAGTVVVEGKNTALVDDCPDNGNLLSAVAIGTCLVRTRTTTTTTTVPTALDPSRHVTGLLKCDTPGCTGETDLHFVPAIALNGGTCSMSVNVTQTDYDDGPGEAVFFTVAGKNMTDSPVQPGNNPCTSEYQGTVLAQADRVFSAVSKFDVTDLVKTTHPLGTLKVTGTITPLVDECGYEGNLLYATLSLDCIPASA